MPTACTPEYSTEVLDRLAEVLQEQSSSASHGYVRYRDSIIAAAKKLLADTQVGSGELIDGKLKRPHTPHFRDELFKYAVETRADLTKAKAQFEARGDLDRYARFREATMRLYRQHKGLLIVQEAALERAQMKAESELFAKFGIHEHSN